MRSKAAALAMQDIQALLAVRVLLAVLTAGLIPIPTGCSLGRSSPEYLIPSKRAANVRLAAESYGDNLRWGRLEAAAGLVDPERREAFMATFRETEPPMRFTSFEIVGMQLGPRRDEAEVLARFRLYRLPDLTERTIRERQFWRFHPQSGEWYVRPDLSLFMGS